MENDIQGSMFNISTAYFDDLASLRVNICLLSDNNLRTYVYRSVDDKIICISKHIVIH